MKPKPKEHLSCAEIVERIKSMKNPDAVAGMARFGINPKNNYGASIPALRAIAKSAGKDNSLALELWATEIHDARLLAGMVGDPKQITEKQMDRWARDFDSWDVCDQCCSNLFDKTQFARKKALEWSKDDSEFVKRAGFVIMAALAVHDKKAGDEIFETFLRVIKREAGDERNYVKKAVNWALRGIGKRNTALNEKAIETAKEIHKNGSKPAKWIASDAIRELESGQVKERLARKIR